MKKKDLKDLLNKLAGNTITPEEFSMLKRVMEDTSDNELNSHLLSIWETTKHNGSMDGNTKHDIMTSLFTQIVKSRPKRKILSWRAVAIVLAPILLFASYTLYLYNAENVTPQRFVVSAYRGQKTHIELPDGSHVWLNSDSKLEYNTNYNIKNRVLKLEGEAFFDVRKNENHPFVVNAEVIEAKVLGTQFVIQSYKDEDFVSISLMEGKVRVNDAKTKASLVDILPDEKIIFNKTNSKWHVEACDGEMEKLWTSNILRFENASIEEVITKLERWYGVHIHINLEKKHKNTRYGFTIKSESLKETLQLINQMTPISYRVNGEEVIIKIK